MYKISYKTRIKSEFICSKNCSLTWELSLLTLGCTYTVFCISVKIFWTLKPKIENNGKKFHFRHQNQVSNLCSLWIRWEKIIYSWLLVNFFYPSCDYNLHQEPWNTRKLSAQSNSQFVGVKTDECLQDGHFSYTVWQRG